MTYTKIDWNNPKAKISKYFTVWEVTKNDPRRVPQVGSEVEREILKLAGELDKIREEWGYPILVTSWYRPPNVNRAVGGASGSQHVYGRAADIRPVNSDSLAKFQSWLDQNWFGALGYGARRGFVHIDTRNGKGWRSGGEKGTRWNY
ncbi:Peptidase M15A C-terminal domain-containing protein [Microcystis aeruginosa]